MNTIKVNLGGVKMIAHRGLSGIERENTCPAFVAAGNRSYFGIETDIHKSADGKFVILHNQTLSEVSLGKYDTNVEASTYDEVKDIVLPDKDGSFTRQDIRVPLLAEYVKICKKYDKKCVLELKNVHPEDELKAIIEEIKALNYLDNMIFISFMFSNCRLLRALLPEANIQFLCRTPSEETLEKMFALRLGLDIYYPDLTPELVTAMHEHGLEVNVWTCDSKTDAEKLAEMGVDYITTNILE
ncbi:MAG: hypothetical protein IJ323_00090 [Clostridia bacterium]|nr:hypothetical protein [Clostridia bacterium]